MSNPTTQTDARLTGRIAGELTSAVWRYRKETSLSIALMLAAKLCTVLIPLALKHIVDELNQPLAKVLFPVFLVLAYALLRFLGDALNEARDVTFSIVTQRTVAAFAERTFSHLLHLSARFHAKRETGSIVRDVQKGADGIGFLLGVALFTIVPTAFEIFTIVAIMVHSYPHEFTLTIAITFACYGVYTYIFTRRRVAFQRAVNRFEAQSDGRLVDSLLNYDTVKYFATEETEAKRLRTVLEDWVHARTANQRALTALHVGQSAVIALGIGAIMLLAAQHVVVGRMSVGDLILVNAYIIQVCMPLNTLGFVFRETHDALVNVERMFTILAARGDVGEDVDEATAAPLVVRSGKIEFDHVDFGYDPARPILRDVEFRAYPGKMLAVVGGSGSGKSTLIKLLFRLYRPERGTIRIDGQDIGQVTQKSLREAIGIVPQDTVLFNETIAYNIAYGRPSATRADVARAARAAQLDEFIERLPDHYDTRVGERGVLLSGGERQRIAIARAILKDPHIIVFDEATSALDTRSERAIQSELTRLAQGRTSIVIAHRLSTVVDADWILVMEHGRVVEQGTHGELLARAGVYANMWALQWQQDELEHAQRKLVAQPVELAGLLAAVVDALYDEVIEQKIVLRTELADSALCVTGDPGVLQSAIAVLCRNEMIGLPPGRSVVLHAERHNNHAWISVRGLHDRPETRSQTGVADLERTLTAAGGGLMSMPLDGRLAYVAQLPLCPVSNAGMPSGEFIADTPPLEGLLILVIDDQEEARDALEAVLRVNGARVRLAASGHEALKWLSETNIAHWPRVVLCDIVLTDESGYDVLHRLRELETKMQVPGPAPMPAIALTGFADVADQERGLAEGFYAHMSKPVAPPELIATIRRLLVTGCAASD